MSPMALKGILLVRPCIKTDNIFRFWGILNSGVFRLGVHQVTVLKWGDLVCRRLAGQYSFNDISARLTLFQGGGSLAGTEGERWLFLSVSQYLLASFSSQAREGGASLQQAHWP